MTRPTVPPDWATDTNFPAGGDPWSATPTRVTPSSGAAAAGFTPKTKGAAQKFNSILGTHGDWLNYLDGQMNGTDFFLRDDFGGSALNLSNWLSDPGVTLPDDASAGAFGAMQLSVGSATTKSFKTANCAFGSVDFRVSFRARVPSMGGGSSFVILGLYDSGGSTLIDFSADAGVSANWRVFINGSHHDSGVAFGSTYQKLEIQRTGGTFYFLINGAIVYQETFSLSTIESIGPIVSRDTSGTTTLLLDYVLGWASR